MSVGWAAWSLFTEYKFLAGIDPSFNLNPAGNILGTDSPGNFKSSYLGQHLVTAGVKYSF